MKTLTKNLREEIVAFRLSRLARDVKRQNLTYLTNEKLLRLQRTLRAVEASRTEGDFIEFGVALGGSAILIATAAKGKRRFLGFDVFGLIPEPSSEKDDETSRRRFKEIVAGASPGIGGTWRGRDFSDTGSSDCLKQPFSSRRHWHQTPTLHHGAAFPVEEAFAFQLRADIANRRLRPAINQVVQLSPADGADVSTIAAAAPRASMVSGNLTCPPLGLLLWKTPPCRTRRTIGSPLRMLEVSPKVPKRPPFAPKCAFGFR